MYRPTILTVTAIIGIVLGGVGLLCCPYFTFVDFFSLLDPIASEADPRAALYAERPLVAYVQIAWDIIGFFLSVYLIVCSIGALMMKRWAVNGMRAYAIASLLLTIFGIAFWNLSGFMNAVGAAAAEQSPDVDVSIMPAVMAVISGGYLCCAGWYPILVLITFSSTSVRNAFDGQGPGGGYYPPPPSGGGYPPPGGYSQSPAAESWQNPNPPQQPQPPAYGGYEAPPNYQPPPGYEGPPQNDDDGNNRPPPMV